MVAAMDAKEEEDDTDDRPFQRFLKPGRRRHSRQATRKKRKIFQPNEFDFSGPQPQQPAEDSNDAAQTTIHNPSLLPFLPTLLFEREIFGPYGKQSKLHLPWKHRLLMEPNRMLPPTGTQPMTDRRPANSISRCWRDCFQVRWKFRDLKTPALDAVLALNAQGTRLIALHYGSTETQRSSDSSYSQPLLSLRVYGMAAKTNQQTPATLLFTLPLIRQGDDCLRDRDDDRSFLLLNEGLDIETIARIPVRIWWSLDDRLGIVMYRTNPKPNGLATIIIFSTKDCRTIWRLHNIPIPCQSRLDAYAAIDPSFLWNVNYIPYHHQVDPDPVSTASTTHAPPSDAFGLCNDWIPLPAYLFLIDEGDGFRMAWIRDSGWIWNDRKRQTIQPLWSNRDDDTVGVVRSNETTRIVVRIPDADSEWHQCCPMSDASSSSSSQSAWNISFHAFLSTSSLLHSILSRNPHLVSPKFDASAAVLPNYFDHHIVHILHGGRCLELFLIFAVNCSGGGSDHHHKTKKGGCVGVFCHIDLFTQDYRTIKWIRVPHVDTPPIACGCIALTQRFKFWRDLHQRSPVSSNIQKIYPDAIAVHNIAVRRQKAVASISARDTPVVLSYM
jgi:hypothetical protein